MDFLELMDFFAYDIEWVHEYLLKAKEEKKKEKEQPQAVVVICVASV